MGEDRFEGRWHAGRGCRGMLMYGARLRTGLKAEGVMEKGVFGG